MRSDSVSVSKAIVSLFGISSLPVHPPSVPPHSFWHCTFQDKQNELASLLALWMTCWKDLPWMDDGGGAVLRGREGQRRWPRFVQPQWVVPYIPKGTEAGSSPCTSMHRQHQAQALVTPGPGLWAPCPFHSWRSPVLYLEQHAGFNRLWDKEQRGH